MLGDGGVAEVERFSYWNFWRRAEGGVGGIFRDDGYVRGERRLRVPRGRLVGGEFLVELVQGSFLEPEQKG